MFVTQQTKDDNSYYKIKVSQNDCLISRSTKVLFPGVVMTAEFPGVVKLNDFLRGLSFDALANLVELLSIHRNGSFENGDFTGRPVFYR